MTAKSSDNNEIKAFSLLYELMVDNYQTFSSLKASFNYKSILRKIFLIKYKILLIFNFDISSILLIRITYVWWERSEETPQTSSKYDWKYLINKSKELIKQKYLQKMQFV